MIAALGLILVLGIVTTAATRRYIREQAGSERSLTVGPEAMYEAEPFAAEAAENGLAEDTPEPSSKKMTHAESVGTEDRACMQAEGDVSVQSLGEQKEKRADNRAAAKAAEKQSAGDESDHSVNTGAVVSPVENGIVSPARPPGQVQARTGQRKITGTGWARSRIRFKTWKIREVRIRPTRCGRRSRMSTGSGMPN